MIDLGKSDSEARAKSREPPKTDEVFGIELQNWVVLAVAAMILPAVLVAPVGAGSSGTTWWNKSGNYYGGAGLHSLAQTCGQTHAPVLHQVGVNLENTTLNGCIGGKEFFVPNDDNDDALPTHVLINIEDEDVGSSVQAKTNSITIGANQTGAAVSFYTVDYKHGDAPHYDQFNFTTICNSANLSIPSKTDAVGVYPDGEPVTAMKDCGNGFELFGIMVDHRTAGSFGTKGTIYANFSN